MAFLISLAMTLGLGPRTRGAGGGGPSTAGQPIGLLLALTKAS